MNLVKEAERCITDGNTKRAMRYLQEADPKGRRPEVQQLVRRCWEAQALHGLKHRNRQQVRAAAEALGQTEAARLAMAAIDGEAALRTVAQEQTVLGALAQARLANDPQGQLRKLRLRPHCQEWADGWIAIYKGDWSRAEAKFKAVPECCPLPVPAGLAVALCMQGRRSEALDAFGNLQELAQRYPLLKRLLSNKALDTLDFWPDAELRQQYVQSGSTPLQQAIGWLREGDAAMPDRVRAVQCWKKAANSEQLALDSLRRCYPCSPGECIDADCAFQQYRAIMRADPAMAKRFIAYLLKQSEFLSSDLQYEEQRIDTPEWQLLCYMTRLIPSEHLLLLPQKPIISEFIHGHYEVLVGLQSIKSDLVQLPVVQAASALHAFAFGFYDLARSTLYRIILNSSEGINDWVLRYHCCCLRGSCDNATIVQEVQDIFRAHSANPYVLHLALRYSVVSTQEMEGALRCQSPAMQAVLELVPLMSRRQSVRTKELQSIPMPQDLYADTEAWWQWMYCCAWYAVPKRVARDYVTHNFRDDWDNEAFYHRMCKFGIVFDTNLFQKSFNYMARLYMDCVSSFVHNDKSCASKLYFLTEEFKHARGLELVPMAIFKQLVETGEIIISVFEDADNA